MILFNCVALCKDKLKNPLFPFTQERGENHI